MSNPHTQAQPGWYPTDGGSERYWDGSAWTMHQRPAATSVPSPGLGGAATADAPTAPPATSPDPRQPKRSWYKRGWVIGVGALLVGLIMGGASAGGASDPKTSSAYKDVAAQLSQANSQLSQAKQDASDAAAQLKQVQGTLPSRESKVKKAEAQVERDAANVSARERAVSRREKAVGIVERTIQENTVSGDGMFRVGVDMKAGTYKSNGASGCYYAVLNSSDTTDIATNNLTNGPAFVTVAPGKYFETQDCADWTLQQ